MKREHQRIARPRKDLTDHQAPRAVASPQSDTAWTASRGPASVGATGHEFGQMPVTPPTGVSVEDSASRDAESVTAEIAQLDTGTRESVSRAQRAPGRPLPGRAREEMEHSFGTDLGEVRVHTDTASAEAASGLGARAFTLGDHVYFGSGQFNTGAGDGKRLLAHELAHVVQAGGRPADAPTRVSSAADPAERAARRAADAISAGGRVSVQRLPGVGGNVVHREIEALRISGAKKGKYNPAEALQEQAESTEQLDIEMGMETSTGANQRVLEVTNVEDTKMAEKMIKTIRDAEPELLEGLKHGVGKVKLEDNKIAISTLGEYLAAAGMQTTSMSNFQQQYATLMRDYDRLDVMATMLDVRGASGAEVGKQIVESQHLTERDREQQRADVGRNKATAGPMATKRSEYRSAVEHLTDASRKMSGASESIRSQGYKLQHDLNEIAAGLPTREKPKEVQELNELKEKLDVLKNIVKTITGIAFKAAGGPLGLAAGGIVEGVAGKVLGEGREEEAESLGDKAKEKVTEKAPELLEKLNEYISPADEEWSGALRVADQKAKAALADQEYQAKQSQLNAMTSQKIELGKAVKDYIVQTMALQDAKKRVRDVAIEVGQTADTSFGGHEHKWELLATFLGETEAYLAQSTATIDVGASEQSQAGLTAEKRKMINTMETHVTWWSVHKDKTVITGYEYYVPDRHSVQLPEGKGSARSGQYHKGANDIIDEEIERLKAYHKEIKGMRDIINEQFSTKEKKKG
jgi:hypothetical protein